MASHNPFAVDGASPAAAGSRRISSTSSNPFGDSPSASSSSRPSRKASSANPFADASAADPFESPPVSPTKVKSEAQSVGGARSTRPVTITTTAAKASEASSAASKSGKTPKAASQIRAATSAAPIIPAEHVMTHLDPNAVSVLSSTDQIKVWGADLEPDGDDDNPVAPDGGSAVRRSTVAGRNDPGSAGVYASTLRRTFTLSNRSQLEVMRLVKEKHISIDEALALAATREEEEAAFSISNEAQLDLLHRVKAGELTQEQATSTARELSKEQEELAAQRENEEMAQEFDDFLNMFITGRSRSDSVDSLQEARATAEALFQDPSALDVYCQPVRPLAEIEAEHSANVGHQDEVYQIQGQQF
ncbi:uncharacterized protein MONBRDRAFT_8884 [Monosiga brevicollis MX1]|uniref:Uncharacterized protein n=1 Tax=Monosiga brevicollis TaxID=81824 RepID=A9V1E7_MONBE|nr:uncharacterized protein MONBRDRAFT_8884 [Monosiga brevicollis MX1]EDQ88554.1 predicted protein [Monosiga brevicollis MX1]|eukprot:XP_001746658.1 hypothetical protein [Monosiga brevicollis MX1]